jgi:acylphosphatase
MPDPVEARRWLVAGRVQGVGFRWFALREAEALQLRGYARNLDDGRVEVYAIGSRHALDEMAGRLRMGPRHADVRAVEESQAQVLKYEGFTIRD